MLAFLSPTDKHSILLCKDALTYGGPLDCSSVGYRYEEIHNPQRSEEVLFVRRDEDVKGFIALRKQKLTVT